MLVAGVTTPHVDPTVAKNWLAAVHQVARETGGRVLGPVELPTVGRDYYRIRAEADGERLRLLLNAATTLVAAVDDTDALARVVPRPDLFTAVGLQVAVPADLEARLPTGSRSASRFGI